MRLLIGMTALIAMLPKIGLQCLRAWYEQDKISLYTRNYAGRGMKKMQHRTVMIANRPLLDFDTWFLYLSGKLNLIGPKPMLFEQAYDLGRGNRDRLRVAPGLISPYEVKCRSGIAHQDENAVSIEFANTATRWRRLQLVLVWLTQKILSTNRKKLASPTSFDLFGVKLSNLTMKSAIAQITQCLRSSEPHSGATKFAFVNADCVNQYCKDSEYKQALNNFDQIFADGIGVNIAAKLQGIRLNENINGTDMFPLLCEQLASHKTRIFLFGATERVINKVVSKLASQYPAIEIAGFQDGFGHARKDQELCARINASNADLVFVAMGAPRQERWIDDNSSSLSAKAIIGVGGLFDFYSDEVSRAPLFLRELSLEWVWRLLVQPKEKAIRYLVGNPLFLLRIVRAKCKAMFTIEGASHAFR